MIKVEKEACPLDLAPTSSATATLVWGDALAISLMSKKDFKPEDKYVLAKDNPPSVEIKFFDNQKNIKNINCFSNEGDNWGNPNISIDENNIMKISFKEKIVRIGLSLLS